MASGQIENGFIEAAAKEAGLDVDELSPEKGDNHDSRLLDGFFGDRGDDAAENDFDIP